jgi:3-isopropylmalate/(R)-2-methylmalate dehydratase small subunit
MKIWIYGDDVNTDQLFPGKRCYTCNTVEEMKPYILEDLDPEFANNVQEGDIIVAGKNFGCGSSREQPVLALRGVGVAAVIARSFARIFYRASINQGLLLIESPEAVDAYKPGDEIEVDPENGRVRVGNNRYDFPGIPEEIMAIREAGGLLEYTRKKLGP